jgi:hypothetical protein
MNYTVKAQEQSSLTLSPSNTVEEVLQNVRVIISTIKGDVPLDRAMGLRGKFLDKPISVAKAILVTEILEALEAYEPRAELLSADFDIDENVPGKLIPTVEVKIIDE